MAELDSTTVLKRAKALAERDGFAWEFDLRPVVPGGNIELRRPLSEARRRLYLDCARMQLHKEGGGDA